MITVTNNKDIKVNDQLVTMEQLQEMMKEPDKKIIQIAPNRFKLLERMYG